MKHSTFGLGSLTTLCLLLMVPAMPAMARWYAVPVAVIEGFKTPESVLVDPAGGVAYVSNVETASRGYWMVDGQAFISKLKVGESVQLEALRWIDSTPQHTFNALKGLCLLNGKLFAADIDRIREVSIGTGGQVRTIRILRARQLNDMATDGKNVYVSDTGAGRVWRVNFTGYGHFPIQAPPSVNGITFFKGKMFAVSWELHEVYELDPTGRRAPISFGLSRHFISLDGIEVMDDGTFLVSDFKGNKVSAISADRTRVDPLVRLESPADIGYDRQRKLLFVPQFMVDRVAVYRLTTEKPSPAELRLPEKKTVPAPAGK
ncbi:MAG: hypothetical protein GXP31_00930 [Kiritimatiellaeota bacterium]|nr:hypothetical protein [Kiritimatiellota bacterium]